MYRPNEAAQMTTPMRLQVPVITSSYGVKEKSWEDAMGVIMANFKTFGGTEITSNETLVIEDTAQVVCWYRPDIKGGCRVVLLESGATYEIVGNPEDIEARHQFLKFKVRRIVGGA